MKPASVAMRWTAWLAVLGIGWAPLASAAVAADPSPTVADVALREGGLLIGQVLDPQGIAKARVPVALRSGRQQLAVGVTDTRGYFAFGGLQGGIYHLATPQGQGVYRVWTLGTAPPSAQPGALVVEGREVARGVAGPAIPAPWAISAAAVAAAGTTTGVIVANEKKDEPHSP